MNKKALKNHFLKFSVVYLLILVLSIILWLWILPAKTRLKSYEKVGIFIGAKTYNEVVLKDKIVEDNKDLLKVEVYAQDPDNFYYVSYLQSAGKQSCDFFIFQRSSISDDIIQALCVYFEADKWQNEFASITELLNIDNRTYGFKLNNNNQLLNGAISFDDEKEGDYYLLINRKSRNFGQFYDNKTQSDNALKAIHSIID